MKVSVALTAALAVSALVAAELCRPSAPELAWMALKDEHFTEAARIVRQISARGDLSTDAISVKVAFLVESGDVESAIGMLERYLAQHPNDRPGKRLLAQLYGDAQRPADRLRVLRALDREAPDSEQLRELAVGFAHEGDWAARRGVLADLVRQADAQPADFIELTRIDAATGHAPEALRTLEVLRQRYPGSYDDDLRSFYEALQAEVEAGRSGGDRRISSLLRQVLMPRVATRRARSGTSRVALSIRSARAQGVGACGGHPSHAAAGAGGNLLPALDKAADDDARTAIIERLDRAGASAASLAALEHLSDRDPDTWLSAYVEHAKASHAQARMLHFLAVRAANKALTRPQREAFAYVMLDQGLSEVALPVLATLAADFGGDWEDAYSDALTKLHHDSDLHAHLMARAMREDTPPDIRRALAWQLLDSGQKQDAQRVFQQLSLSEAADGDDVEELLSLWGEPLSPPQLSWLQSRAASASVEARAGWMRRLTAAGAPKGAIAVFESTARPTTEMRIARLEALSAIGDQSVLGAAVRAEVDRPAETPDVEIRTVALHKLGDFAKGADLAAESERAYGSWATLDPRDVLACRSYALAALAAGHPAIADDQLSRCRTLGPPDFEMAIAAGDAAVARGDPRRARASYKLALQLSKAHPSDEASQVAARARALEHVGRFTEADTTYRELIARSPVDLDVRADWADMLLNAGLTQRAYEVATAPVAGGMQASTPVRRRLELLAARAEMRLGRTQPALARLQSLHDTAPHDPEVLTVLAGVERQLERWRPARNDYLEAARASATAEIHEQIADIDREQGARTALDLSYFNSQHGPTMALTRLSCGQRLSPAWLLAGDFEEAHVDAQGVQHPGGELLDFNGDRIRGAFSLQHDAPGGDIWRTSAYTGYRDTLGLGLAVSHVVRWGSISGNLEYHRPNWDFTEGLVSGATRDKVSAGPAILSGPSSLRVELGVAHYRLAGMQVARSTSVSASYRRSLLGEASHLWLVYTLDGEYFRDIRHAMDSNGNRFEPLPAANRELHFLQLETSRELGVGLGGRGLGALSAGGVANRFGRVEPAVTGSFNWTRSDIQLRLYVTHEPSTAAQYDVVTSVGTAFIMTFP